MATERRSDAERARAASGLSVANAGSGEEQVRVVLTRDGVVREAYRTLAPGQSDALRLPEGPGAVRVELYTRDAVATTVFDPADGGAFLDVVDGAVTFSRL